MVVYLGYYISASEYWCVILDSMWVFVVGKGVQEVMCVGLISILLPLAKADISCYVKASGL